MQRVQNFDNVCLNHSSLEIMFYKGTQDVLYYHEQSGEAKYNFPDDFLMLGMPGPVCNYQSIFNFLS